MAKVTFKAMDERGQPLSRAFLETLYLSSLGYKPFKTNILDIDDERVTLVPPSEPFQAVMVTPVKGFGSIYLYADNEGKGFTGDETEIDLSYEAAKTRIFKVRKWIQEQERRGFTTSQIVEERLESAEKHLREAQGAEAGSKKRTAATLNSLKESLWAGEIAVLEKARHGITVRGWREGFLFGCNCFGHPGLGPKYDELFLKLFNYATVPFYWAGFEPRRGEKGWNRTDEMASWLQKNRATAKGHPLVWFHSAGIPDWVRNMDYETLKALTRDRVHEIVEHYRGTIDIFDVINEAHDWANELGYSREQLLEMTRLACEMTREANPEAIRVVNNCCTWGEYTATDTTYFGKSSRPLITPYKYLENCLRAGIDFEVVGLQLYYPIQDMFEIDLQLDRFARLGKEIHVTELGVSSANVADPNAYVKEVSPFYWHQQWSEDVQADWIEEFYTLCYSKPYITAITWWDFADAGHFWPYGGFLKPDLTPKKSYNRLRNLIDNWKSL